MCETDRCVLLLPCDSLLMPSSAMLLLLLITAVGRPQTDADDDKLRRHHWGHAHVANKAPVIDIGLRHGGAVAFHKEGFLLFRSLKRPIPPHHGKKGGR